MLKRFLNLLFNNEDKFHSNFHEYRIIKNQLSEFTIFLNSGGVVNNTFHLPVNRFLVNFVWFVTLNFIRFLQGLVILNFIGGFKEAYP